MHVHPLLRKLSAGQAVDVVYLDTTYANPRFAFPPQSHVLQQMAIRARQEQQAAKESGEKLLFVVNTYHIGKERAVFALAEALGSQVYATAAKQQTLRRLELPSTWLQRLTDD